MNTENMTPIEQLRRSVAGFSYIIPYILILGLVGIALRVAVEYWRVSTYGIEMSFGWLIGPLGMWAFAFILYVILHYRKKAGA